MGGQQGSRGYLYQGIVSIFSACTENSWEQISVEYSTDNDKVDIALLSGPDNVLKTIQVKSSINLFTKSDIVVWLTDLFNDVSAKEYQLVLIGNCQESANKLIKSIEKFRSDSLDKESKSSLGSFISQLSGKNVKIMLLPFSEDHLMGVVRDSLNKFISCQGYTIDYVPLEEICLALLSLHMFLGTKGSVISKTDYEKRIINWLVSSSNGSMKRISLFSELKVMIFHQVDESISDNGYSIPFAKMASLYNYRNQILQEGKSLIEQIGSIKLPTFEQANEIHSIDAKEKPQCAKWDPRNFDSGFFPKIKNSELSGEEEENTKKHIKEYWDVDVSADFFYVGNLTESTLLTSLTGRVDYTGTDVEKRKNAMISKIRWRIVILECIDYIIDIFKNVHLLPLCITNTSNILDEHITVSLFANESFHVFSLNYEIIGDSREMLDVLSDTLIEKKIIENILSIKPTTNIDLEPETRLPSVPFSIPISFGGRRRNDFNNLVIEWGKYQAPELTNGTISYEISSLRPGETKWLSPYMIIVPATETFSLEFTILSKSSGCKKSGAIDINTTFFLNE